MKIALVIMPWVDIEFAPLGVACLKAAMEKNGHDVDCVYLNLLLAERMGRAVLPVNRSHSLWPEWFFSQHIFGSRGTGELPAGLDQIYEGNPSFKEFLEECRWTRQSTEDFLASTLPDFLHECAVTFPWGSYDLIGFSSYLNSHAACLAFSKELKSRFPQKPIVFGGGNVEGVMGAATLESCNWIDYVVSGEGEKALGALAKNIEDGRPYEPVAGVSFRRNGIVVISGAVKEPVDVNELPPPNHDDFYAQINSLADVKKWLSPIPSFEASRGCWWGEKQHCTFCGLNGLEMTYRSKSAGLAVRDLLHVHERYKALLLWTSDMIMGTEHLSLMTRELARIRQETGAEWEVFYEVKSNLTYENIRSLAEAGITQLQAGIESLSTPLLRLMRKGVRAIQNIQTLKWAAACGVDMKWNFLFGFPGEPQEEYEKMADLMPSLTHLQPPLNAGAARPDRFSPYQGDPERFGISRPTPDPCYAHIWPQPRFRLEDICYYFIFDPRDVPQPPSMPVFHSMIAFWRSMHPNTFFVYRQGIGFVRLFDSRPLKPEGAPAYRETILTGLPAKIFNVCWQIRTIGQIVEACRKDFPAAAEKTILAAVEEMSRRKWLLHEDNFYLALAVPATRISETQKKHFAAMRLLSQTVSGGAGAGEEFKFRTKDRQADEIRALP